MQGNTGNDLLRGDAGDDQLQGGKGQDILLGGTDSDHLDGGDARDLLIGGQVADVLQGGNGQDILIGGYTVWDNDHATLQAALDAWTSPGGYNARVAFVRASFFYGGIVQDDGVQDVLEGGSGRDWFFADLDGMDEDDDTLMDVLANEMVEMFNGQQGP